MSIETAARKFLEAWYREFYAGTEEGEPTLDTPKLDALDLAYIELKRALETPPSAGGDSEQVRNLRANIAAARAVGKQRLVLSHALEEAEQLANWMERECHRACTSRRSQGAEDIAAERLRQINEEHWNPEHDDDHDDYQLSRAAMAYVEHAREQGPRPRKVAEHIVALIVGRWWPWDMEWWKPRDPRRNLVRAGALIAAEIDRLQRMQGHREGTG